MKIFARIFLVAIGIALIRETANANYILNILGGVCGYLCILCSEEIK